MMPLQLSHAELPIFFEEQHTRLASRLTSGMLSPLEGQHDAAFVARHLGQPLGLYAFLVPEVLGGASTAHSDHATYIDVRSLVLIREALGQVCPLADAIFAVQGLAGYPLVLAGNASQRQAYLQDMILGKRIGAFALTEPEAGSDVAALKTRAQKDGEDWVLDGQKTLISNVPIADLFVVFANANPEAGRKGITAFVVERDNPGLVTEPMGMSIAHPMGRLQLNHCRVGAKAVLGEVGRGFRLAMETLDAFRISVGAAANGMASRAMAKTLVHVTSRRQFGAFLADQQMVRAYLAEMATELDASRLLVARAAHKRDVEQGRVTVEAAMAKMFATEAAQRIIDRAVQLHGGMGVMTGTEVESLYREIRPLRIYEGTTEIQKLIIAKGILADRE